MPDAEEGVVYSRKVWDWPVRPSPLGPGPVSSEAHQRPQKETPIMRIPSDAFPVGPAFLPRARPPIHPRDAPSRVVRLSAHGRVLAARAHRSHHASGHSGLLGDGDVWVALFFLCGYDGGSCGHTSPRCKSASIHADGGAFVIPRPGRSHYAMIQEIKPTKHERGESFDLARLITGPAPRCLAGCVRLGCSAGWWTAVGGASTVVLAHGELLPCARGPIRQACKSRSIVAGRPSGAAAASDWKEKELRPLAFRHSTAGRLVSNCILRINTIW
ncbi:uncharacterized protein C8Q71DRAFT_7293 [Rhodofomes roseus]|uniref:Uncharacterized protein n=1 Tax=Rhodofomes roseus TaxID=34475 RepID=A0ABQ8KWC6_9APHY|nr:uncharacterized protein C8Q71DRAFT_7293 [Rhodofomes roseus]KAH9843619.1 hypothetical protein C8Q71DRAFT_7293 [Rhodofomes roseus]